MYTCERLLAKDAPDAEKIVGDQIGDAARSAAHFHKGQQKRRGRYYRDYPEPRVRSESLSGSHQPDSAWYLKSVNDGLQRR